MADCVLRKQGSGFFFYWSQEKEEGDSERADSLDAKKWNCWEEL